ELVADSLPDYVRAWFARLRAGESGKLPVIIGMVIIAVIFQTLNDKFLTAGNLVNLLVQGAVYMLLAMAEVFVLLLGEIDLSAGFVGGIGGIVTAELVKYSVGWPWWAAILAALAVCAVSGLFAPPVSFTLIKIAFAAAAGVVVVWICNTDRGVLVPIKGVPWVVLIVLGVLVAWTILLGRTKFGRYVYAIGGNAEAARRAG